MCTISRKNAPFFAFLRVFRNFLASIFEQLRVFSSAVTQNSPKIFLHKARSSQPFRLNKNKNLTLPVLLYICVYFGCDFGDIMQAVPEHKEPENE